MTKMASFSAKRDSHQVIKHSGTKQTTSARRRISKIFEKHFYNTMEAMKRKNVLVLTLSLFYTVGIINAQMSVFWADTLNKTLAQGFAAENMKGLAGAVVFSDGSVWSGAEGNHFGNPLSNQYLYDIGSNTKSLVSAIILKLEEEGQLNLSDSLISHISPVNNVPAGVTLEQLLGHRSGVYNYTEHPNFYDEIEKDENKFWHPDTILATFVLSPTFPPGQQFRYSNTGYLLLGKVIEAIENKPLNVVFKDRIFQPNGLNNMFLAQYDMYTSTKTGAWLSPTWYYPSIESFLGAAWAAGGIVAQPEDFAIYAHKLLRGDLLTPSSMQKMRTGTPLTGGAIYGLGIIESNYMGNTYLGHGGTTLQNSEMEYSISSDFSLVLVNLDNGFIDETRRVRNDFLELLEYIHQSGLSVNEPTEDSFQTFVYPNPSTNYITLERKSNHNSDSYIEVRDLAGKLLLHKKLRSEPIKIQKGEVGEGIFIVSVYENSELVGTNKIIFN